jgi:hypothetical protein
MIKLLMGLGSKLIIPMTKKLDNFEKLFEWHNIDNEYIIVLDIDETVLYFENVHDQWWSETVTHYYNGHHDYERAENESLREWKEVISLSEPKPTDIRGINRLITEDVRIIFLTARDPDFEEITKGHLEKIGFESPVVIFCSQQNKGILLEKWLSDNDENNETKRIIFVDDKEHNIKNVKQVLPHVYCYHFNKS